MSDQCKNCAAMQARRDEWEKGAWAALARANTRVTSAEAALAAREAAWAEKYAAVVGERDEWEKAAWDALTPDHNCDHKAALATALREKAEDRARVEAVLPAECWVSRDTVVRCTDYIGGTFSNGAEWTEDLCCLPCRLRAALAIPTATGDE